MKKIVFIGPESTGKSTLAEQLAKYYRTTWVEEYARSYIDKLNRPYEESDLITIAQGQLLAEAKKEKEANEVLFCDTDLIVIEIWSTVKYGKCDKWTLEQIKQCHYDLYFLCGTDVPWEYDEQREHPEFREELFEMYESKLIEYNKKYIKLIGNKQLRLKKAIKIVDKLLLLKK
ncbi:MAG: AAA family ATPase [Saprospiraceae bacterium]